MTADRLVQFYHTLEGMPLGWSMDLIVPSDSLARPETALQLYAGISVTAGRHSFTGGAYWKSMENLVYYTQASAIFSAARAGWKDNLDVGEGTSRGLESMYEYIDGRLYVRAAYTLSKTDRAFPRIADGATFPAKFDRRHILNLNGSYTISSDKKKSALSMPPSLSRAAIAKA